MLFFLFNFMRFQFPISYNESWILNGANPAQEAGQNSLAAIVLIDLHGRVQFRLGRQTSWSWKHQTCAIVSCIPSGICLFEQSNYCYNIWQACKAFVSYLAHPSILLSTLSKYCVFYVYFSTSNKTSKDKLYLSTSDNSDAH